MSRCCGGRSYLDVSEQEHSISPRRHGSIPCLSQLVHHGCASRMEISEAVLHGTLRKLRFCWRVYDGFAHVLLGAVYLVSFFKTYFESLGFVMVFKHTYTYKTHVSGCSSNIGVSGCSVGTIHWAWTQIKQNPDMLRGFGNSKPIFDFCYGLEWPISLHLEFRDVYPAGRGQTAEVVAHWTKTHMLA